MFKFGYYCLAEGRQILLQISKATNKYRYTNSVKPLVKLPSDSVISKILSLPAPFDISSGKSHFELAKTYAINRGGRKGFTVYIYDQGKQIANSPFSTYRAGHVAIGLLAGSMVISRYIDTGKVYKNRFTFYSKNIKEKL